MAMRITLRVFSILKSSLRPSSTLISQLSPTAPKVCTSCLLRPINSSPGSARTYARTASSKRWADRQIKDPFTRAAKAEQLRSRAGYKLMELNLLHRLLKPGMTVVDLGYAPGAWTEVAVQFTKPDGRVIGVDVLPAVPPSGASTFQGNFLCENVQNSIKQFLASHGRGRSQEHFIRDHGYFEAEREETGESGSGSIRDENVGKNTVDVVISDMLMNVTGLRSRDHLHSMDLCVSALLFCIDVLKPGGDFVCKYYAGGHDKEFEKGLGVAFTRVYREKPDSSRPESREGFFVAKKMKPGLTKNQILKVMPSLV